MPERLPTAKPQVTIGSTLLSGDVNTGQMMNTFGGAKYAMKLSGVVGPDVQIWVGGGRLDLVQLFPPASAAAAPAASGLAIVFYDTAAAISGGPFTTSGHKVLASLSPVDPALFNQPIFNSGLGCGGRGPLQLGIPFTSGLAVFTQSGQVGWGATFTPSLSG